MEVGPLSASTLAYLFGHELAGEVSHHRIHQVQYGIEVPTTGVIVVGADLDAQVLTLALWEAHDLGALQIDLVGSPGVRGKVAGSAVVFAPMGALVALPGLAGRLVPKVRWGDTLVKVLRRLWPEHSDYLPHNALVLDAQREAVEVGALTAATSPEPASHALRWSSGLPRFEVVDGGLTVLEQLWDEVGQRWLEARQADPHRWRAVAAEARHAVKDCRPELRVWAGPTTPQPW